MVDKFAPSFFQYFWRPETFPRFAELPHATWSLGTMKTPFEWKLSFHSWKPKPKDFGDPGWCRYFHKVSSLKIWYSCSSWKLWRELCRVCKQRNLFFMIAILFGTGSKRKGLSKHVQFPLISVASLVWSCDFRVPLILAQSKTCLIHILTYVKNKTWM